MRFALAGLCAGAFGGVALLLYYQALSLGEMGITTALTGLLTALVPVVYSFFAQGSPKISQIAGFVLAAAAIALIAYRPAGRAPSPRAWLRDPGRPGLWGVSGGFESGQRARPAVAAHFFPLGQCHTGVCDGDLDPGAQAQGCDGMAQASARESFLFGSRDLPGCSRLREACCICGRPAEGRLDVAAVLASLYPVVTIILAACFLKERTTSSQALGMALALGAVVLVSL